jgi:hypothetical protein
MRRLATPAALLLSLLCVASARAADFPDRLLGTWYVLVHYKDAHAANVEAERWDDRVWVFEKKGDRLAWTEYPIVVFKDESGRFENTGTNRMSRVVGAWEPNAAQSAQIAEGLEVNPRGMLSKTLRSTRGAWRSANQPTAASASVVSYVENWSIEGTPQLPIFRREDSLGGERTETLDGVTLYTTTQVDASGDVLSGTFERDGTRHGTFRVARSGPVSDVKGSGKTQTERVRDAFIQNMGREVVSGELSPEERAEVHADIRRSIEDYLRRKGIDPATQRPQVESMTAKIEHLLIDEKRSLQDVGRMLEAGEIKP